MRADFCKHRIFNYHLIIVKFIFLSCIFFLTTPSFSQDGTIDNSFSQVSNFQSEIDFSAIQIDNKILLSGYGINPNNPNQTAKLVRLDPNGQLDTIWYFQGGSVQRVYTQPDGKILRISSYENPNYTNNYGIHRLQNDGAIDNSFYPNSIIGTNGSLGVVNCISEINSGKMIIGGTFLNINGTSKTRVARIHVCSTVEVNDTVVNCGEYISPVAKHS